METKYVFDHMATRTQLIRSMSVQKLTYRIFAWFGLGC